MSLTILLALFAGATAEGNNNSRRITLLEPSWMSGEISVDARLVVLAEVVPAELLEDIWIELRTNAGWERRAVPSSGQLRLSARLAVAAVAVEPRRIPGVRVGDQVEIRIRATYRDGDSQVSEALAVQVADADRREADLLDRLGECHRRLESLQGALEEDYRKLSRLERRLTEREALDRKGSAELAAIDDLWKERLRAMLQAGNEVVSILDQAATDRFVDSAREAAYRKIAARLRACGSEEGVVSSPLARARGNIGREERREALDAALDAQDKRIEAFKKQVAELKAWRENVEVRRNVRSLLQAQKGLNGELELQRDRDR